GGAGCPANFRFLAPNRTFNTGWGGRRGQDGGLTGVLSRPGPVWGGGGAFGPPARHWGQASATPVYGWAHRGHRPTLRRSVGKAARMLAPSTVVPKISATWVARPTTSGWILLVRSRRWIRLRNHRA